MLGLYMSTVATTYIALRLVEMITRVEQTLWPTEATVEVTVLKVLQHLAQTGSPGTT